MGIRKRLVTLSVGIAVPLTLVGLAMMWGLWRESRRQLDDSIGKQSAWARGRDEGEGRGSASRRAGSIHPGSRRTVGTDG